MNNKRLLCILWNISTILFFLSITTSISESLRSGVAFDCNTRLVVDLILTRGNNIFFRSCCCWVSCWVTGRTFRIRECVQRKCLNESGVSLHYIPWFPMSTQLCAELRKNITIKLQTFRQGVRCVGARHWSTWWMCRSNAYYWIVGNAWFIYSLIYSGSMSY